MWGWRPRTARPSARCPAGRCGVAEPYYADEHVTLYHGDCRDILAEVGSVDIVVTDPPYSTGRSESEFAATGNIAVALHMASELARSWTLALGPRAHPRIRPGQLRPTGVEFAHSDGRHEIPGAGDRPQVTCPRARHGLGLRAVRTGRPARPVRRQRQRAHRRPQCRRPCYRHRDRGAVLRDHRASSLAGNPRLRPDRR